MGFFGNALMGDVFSGLGKYGSEQIFGLLDKIGGGSSTSEGGGSAVDAMNKAMNDILGRAGQITQGSMYNAAGQTGPAVGNTYAIKNDQLTNTTQALNSYNRQMDAADKGLQSTNRAVTLAGNAFGQQGRNLRNDTMNQLSASGASPAAMGAILGKLNQQMSQGALGLQGQAGQQYAQAAGMAGNLAKDAYGTLAADRALQFETNVKPWEAQVNQGIAGLAGSVAGTAAQANLGQSQMEQFEKNNYNLLGTTAAGFGAKAAGDIEMSQMDEIMAAMQQRYGGGEQQPGVGPGPWAPEYVQPYTL